MKEDCHPAGLAGLRACEDVRCEYNGMQTLVGVVNVIPAQSLPVNNRTRKQSLARKQREV
jgi:hypothetical protein